MGLTFITLHSVALKKTSSAKKSLGIVVSLLEIIWKTLYFLGANVLILEGRRSGLYMAVWLSDPSQRLFQTISFDYFFEVYFDILNMEDITRYFLKRKRQSISENDTGGKRILYLIPLLQLRQRQCPKAPHQSNNQYQCTPQSPLKFLLMMSTARTLFLNIWF